METYDEAAVRHFRDGESLRQVDRHENADQLTGLAAECALKVALSHSVSKGSIDAIPYLHINDLWAKALLQVEAKRFPGLAALLKGANPFSDWEIGQRYHENGCVSEATCDAHRKAARRVLGAVGLLPG